MRKLTRMAAIGSVGLLALTACGDDESDEAQEPTDEQTEAADGGAEGGYSSVDDLDEQAAVAFASANVVPFGDSEYGPVDGVNDSLHDRPFGAACEASGDAFACTVISRSGSGVEQEVTLSFTEGASNGTVNAEIQVGDVVTIYDDGAGAYNVSDGIFDPNGNYDGVVTYEDISLAAFEQPSPPIH